MSSLPPFIHNMDGDVDVKFLQRISDIERNLLTLDPSTVDHFNRQWTILVEDLRVAIDSESLSNSTITIAHSLADKVSLVIQSFLDLEILAEKLMSSLLDETSRTSSPLQLADPIGPAYLKPSYDWLIENIHNPYPTPEVRDAISKKAGVARKDVDNWFIDARKRIGWNEARKAHFSNKRAEIINAATRFFANDEKISLTQAAEHALISIMKNAKDLYSDRFSETVLASRLDAAVKDLTPQAKIEAKAEQLHQRQLKRDRESYPSPEQTPEPLRASPVPCADEDNDAAPKPISISSRKRRDPPIELVEQGEDFRISKRSRLDAPFPVSPSILAFPAGLPSPPSSLDEPLLAAEPCSLPSPSSPTSVTRSRKRHLSESGGQRVPKRPHHLPAAPRLQTVSDPLPLYNNLLFDETSFDGWFQQILDHSDVDDISPSGVSVELGNLSDFDCGAPTESRLVSPVTSRQTFESPVIEVADVPNLLDVPWNGFDFDSLLASSDAVPHSSSLIKLAGQAPLPTPLVQDLSNIHNTSQQSRSSDDFGTFFGLANPNIVHLNPETWELSTSVPIKDGACDFEKHHVNLQGSNGLLTSFDFSDSTDFLTSPNTNFLPTLTQAKIRQEKEKEFREACEKAQRLAFELEKGDLFPL